MTIAPMPAGQAAVSEGLMDSSNTTSAKARVGEPAALHLKLRDGITIAVPASLSAITTYVLLEQEEWFEKEIDFLRGFLKPGMVAIDIGANLGVYSLPMAQLVGAGGHIFSYEPGSQARALLENSKQINGLGNLEIIGSALSDGRRQGQLAFAESSELRALGPAGGGEAVQIASLDSESAEHRWSSVDFVKIDAEGEEERIVTGGRDFFARRSPLVMFEIKAGDRVNERLRTIFPSIGYRLFRQLAGEPVLVPDDPSQPLDDYELNLFAAKPDRVEALSREGLLVDNVFDWNPNDIAADGYEKALSAFTLWRAADEPMTVRCAALAFALKSIRAACAGECNAERASTWARVSWEWGARAESVAALSVLFQILRDRPAPLKEPFWPAACRFGGSGPSVPPVDWFWVAAAEQYERTCGLSTIFSGASPFLSWLCEQRLVDAEMLRRRTLIAARAGQRPRIPERLRIAAPDHLNADIWRAGMVPGTAL
jgi:FkbM family methyltransferase